MAWNQRLSQLNYTVSELVPHHDSITKFVKAAGLKVQDIRFNGTASDIWHSVIDEANKHSKVKNLIESLLEKYPENPFLISALKDKEVNYSLSPIFDSVANWKDVDEDTLEVLTFDSNSLLPINFLKRGIAASRSVAKIEITKGTSTDVGTGFLFRIPEKDETYFMTNHHVINSKENFNSAKIIFNYEIDINNDLKKTKEFKIKSNGFWCTSPINKNDVVIFQLEDDTKELEQFGFLLLEKIDVSKNDFVNVIQHPAGQPKQISLYHNIITDVQKDKIQYLTDTMKGSSGSPVFNSNWKVVAMHQSGGIKKIEKNDFGTKYCNQGININAIIDFILKKRKKKPLPVDKIKFNGYDENFLIHDVKDGKVPLPKLGETNIDDLAAVVGNDDSILNYWNFSTQLSASRKFPFYTASNIDGILFKQAERNDSWKKDKRVKKNQWGQKLYSAENGNFDKGHMTKREDVQWGNTLELAQTAADATFFYPNAVPQHKDLNRRIWKRLENYILHKETKKKSLKICVFTGPILSKFDPPFVTQIKGNTILLPILFWKVVVFPKEDGKLYRVGFMMSQRKLFMDNGIIMDLEKSGSDEELFMQFDNASTYQVNISLIERLSNIKIPTAIDSFKDQRPAELVLQEIDIESELESFNIDSPISFTIDNLIL